MLYRPPGALPGLQVLSVKKTMKTTTYLSLILEEFRVFASILKPLFQTDKDV